MGVGVIGVGVIGVGYGLIGVGYGLMGFGYGLMGFGFGAAAAIASFQSDSEVYSFPLKTHLVKP